MAKQSIFTAHPILVLIVIFALAAFRRDGSGA